MKYFINGKEIKFGDKFFHVRECNIKGINATSTFEGTFNKDVVEDLVEMGVLEIRPDEEEKKDIIEQIDRNIQILERVQKILEKFIG